MGRGLVDLGVDNRLYASRALILTRCDSRRPELSSTELGRRLFKALVISPHFLSSVEGK